MAIITSVNDVESSEVSDLLIWLTGDSAEIVGMAYEPESDPAIPVDLTGATITLIFEYYTATVTVSASRSGVTASISSPVRDTAKGPRTINTVIAADQSLTGNRGQFTWELPGDLLPGMSPEVAITQDVPVALCYVKRTIGIETLTERFWIVFRRGAP